MNKEAFEQRYREEMNQALNQLQALVLSIAELEQRAEQVDQALRVLNQTAEAYLSDDQSPPQD
ncbi:MAG: hypothetical protein AAGF66_09545 [Cyanobacteria bacterium P01_H01_bin.119]